jgi:pheromone shutdown-related protein TraB
MTTRDYPQDVTVVSKGDREFILVGTAHVSKESTELVRQVVEQEKPDRVCVELDEQRYQALANETRWESLDLKQLIRNRQLPTLLANLLLASYQKRLGLQLGVKPGAELLEAVKTAEEKEIPFSLCDRSIRATMLRAWRTMSFWKKNKLVAAFLAAIFSKEELSEEDLRKLREKDVLSEMMSDVAELFPQLSRVLIDERDTYLAHKILESEGRRIVAVVGAGHLEGIRKELARDRSVDLAALETIPTASSAWKWVGWLVPAVILGGLGLIAWQNGAAMAAENVKYWILANSIPCGIGAVLAMAHPLTILAAVLAAPITSLIPVIGAGYVTAFVQAWVCPPRVRDLQNVAEEVSTARCWWSNRLLRVFLAFLLPSLGSILGTYIGGYEILKNVF